jgi:hypothetical protein
VLPLAVVVDGQEPTPSSSACVFLKHKRELFAKKVEKEK